MDFDDFIKYDFLFGDDDLPESNGQTPRPNNDPPPDNSGCGCLTAIVVFVLAILFDSLFLS